jgi:hypothetical protein
VFFGHRTTPNEFDPFVKAIVDLFLDGRVKRYIDSPEFHNIWLFTGRNVKQPSEIVRTDYIDKPLEEILTCFDRNHTKNSPGSWDIKIMIERMKIEEPVSYDTEIKEKKELGIKVKTEPGVKGKAEPGAKVKTEPGIKQENEDWQGSEIVRKRAISKVSISPTQPRRHRARQDLSSSDEITEVERMTSLSLRTSSLDSVRNAKAKAKANRKAERIRKAAESTDSTDDSEFFYKTDRVLGLRSIQNSSRTIETVDLTTTEKEQKVDTTEKEQKGDTVKKEQKVKKEDKKMKTTKKKNTTKPVHETIGVVTRARYLRTEQ